MIWRSPCALLCAAMFAAIAGPARAETSKTFQVSADIVAGCMITLTSGGNWGRIDLGSQSGIASGTVQASLAAGAAAGLQIQCTPGTQLGVTADTGNQPIAGVRQMGIAGNATARIPYQLYADGSATPWTTQSIAIAFPIGTSLRALPIVAKATLGGSQRAGAYTDTVHITLAW